MHTQRIRCNYCNRRIPDTSVLCPNCQHNPRAFYWKRWHVFALVFAAILAAVGIFGLLGGGPIESVLGSFVPLGSGPTAIAQAPTPTRTPVTVVIVATSVPPSPTPPPPTLTPTDTPNPVPTEADCHHHGDAPSRVTPTHAAGYRYPDGNPRRAALVGLSDGRRADWTEKTRRASFPARRATTSQRVVPGASRLFGSRRDSNQLVRLYQRDRLSVSARSV
jgi:hypothetical protein